MLKTSLLGFIRILHIVVHLYFCTCQIIKTLRKFENFTRRLIGAISTLATLLAVEAMARCERSSEVGIEPGALYTTEREVPAYLGVVEALWATGSYNELSILLRSRGSLYTL